MEIKKFRIDNTNYLFVNEAVSTRSGFNHKTSLFEWNYCISTAICHYINRTWEEYSFQSSMKASISNYLESSYDDIISALKREAGVKRVNKSIKARAEILINEGTYKNLKEIYNKL